MVISTNIYLTIIIIDIDSGKKGERRILSLVLSPQNITSSLSFKKREGTACKERHSTARKVELTCALRLLVARHFNFLWFCVGVLIAEKHGKEFFKLSSGNKTCKNRKSFFLYQILIRTSSNLVVKLSLR